MVFSSVLFLFLFLPVALAGYHLIPTVRAKNLWLLVTSLWFYAWGEFRYLPLLLGSIAINFIFGLLIARFTKGSRKRLFSLSLAMATNLGLLIYFKYWSQTPVEAAVTEEAADVATGNPHPAKH